MRFRKLKPWEHKKYMMVHPKSFYGDPNKADKFSFDLIAIKPDGLMVYKRRPWWRE
jgi:hypothetical protein